MAVGSFVQLKGVLAAEPFKGENGPQVAGLYTTTTADPLAIDRFKLVEGAQPSYNNYCDVDRTLAVAVALANVFDYPQYPGLRIAVGVKHGNPCGAAILSGENSEQLALKSMIDGDRKSIFGGTVITNFPIDGGSAKVLRQHGVGEQEKPRILDVVIAPSFTEEGRAVLRRQKDACRMFANPALATKVLAELDLEPRVRSVRGGFLRQSNYAFVPRWDHPEVEVNRDGLPKYAVDLSLAWAVGSRSTSNTITIVKGGQLVGNAVGQQSRVDAVKLALERVRENGHDPHGAVAYSDSFFPFVDGPVRLREAGIKAIFATRGSVRDAEVSEVLGMAGVLFVTLPDMLARGFYGH